MMNKAIGKTVRYSLIVLVVLMAALLAAPFFINVNDYKAEIEQGVENATGRKLSIGAISASLFPWVGVQLEDVHLDNRGGFSDRDFLAVQRLHIKLALLPLLSKEVEIKHFEVVSPKVYLERNANGEANWGDLVSQGGSAAPKEGASAAGQGNGAAPLLAALKAESISLSGGELTWADAEKKPLVLSELELLLNDVQLSRPISTHMSGKLDGNAFNVDAKVGPLGDLNKLDPARLAVQGQVKVDNVRLGPFQDMITGWPAMMGDVNQATAAATANIEARPDGVRTGEGTVVVEGAHKLELNWKIEMPKADQLELRRAELTVDGKGMVGMKGNVKQLTSKPSFQLRLEGQPLQRTWLAGFVPELNSMYAGHPAPWQQVKFNTLIAGDDKHVDIRDLQLMLDGELVQVSGAVVYERPDVRLRISAKDLHVDPWLPQAKGENSAMLQGSGISIVHEAVAAEPPQEPDLRFLKPWLVTAKFKANTLFLRGLEMRNFQAAISGSDGRFVLSPLSFGLSGGNVTEKASINVASYPARWTESVHITGVQVGPLLKTLADMDMLEGTMEMDTNLRATGLSDAAVASLNGRGNVMLRNGKVKGFDIAGALRKFTNPGAATGPQETDFAQLSGSFVITNGVANNQDLFMASPLLRVTGYGKVDLVQKLLDYHVKPRVVGTLKGQGDTALRQGLSVPMHISGPFDSPKIRPEINAKAIIENAPALMNKGKVGGALGKILGKPANGQDAPPADDSAPQQPEKPIDKLRQGLGGLLGR